MSVPEAHDAVLSHSWGSVTRTGSVPSNLGGDSLGWPDLQCGRVVGTEHRLQEQVHRQAVISARGWPRFLPL